MLLPSPLLSRSLDTVIEIAQLEQPPHRTLGADALLLLRMLRMLPARTKELAVKLVLVIGRASAAVALAHPHVVFSIGNLHLSSSPHSHPVIQRYNDITLNTAYNRCAGQEQS